MRLALVVLLAVIAVPAVAGPAEELQALFADEWQARLERDPFFATMQGEHRHDDRAPDVSPAARARHLAEDRAFLDRLQAIDRAALSAADRLNVELFAFELLSRIARAEFRPWRIPFVSDSGFHTRPAFVLEATPMGSVAAVEAYIARLRALPGYIDGNIAHMRQGLADGFTMPRAILDKAEPSFAAHAVVTAEDSVFYAPFETLPESMPAQERDRLRAAGRNAVEAAVLPAYRRLLAFFRETYKPGARETLAATDLPEGEAYYAMLVRQYTTLSLTPREIHEIGLDEVARIRAEMDDIIDETGFDGGFADFLEFLRTDPRFYADSAEALLKEAALIAKRVDGMLPAFFGRLPRMPYGLRAVPDSIAPNYTTGRYWPPIPGRRGGLYMVNTHALDKRPLYVLPALTLHEAVPGHHLQTALAREIEDAPEFRRNLYVVAFGEGWGLYTEKLGVEMGVYRTPYERFGRLTYEMWRAGRLVVDTGIHAMGWSRDRAVRFFRENSALSLHNIDTEVDRYISWPGQALGYKMGELKILELRLRAERALGAAFDIRAFHDAVLEAGSLPLPVLERRIDAFIAAAAGQEAREPDS